MHFLGILWDNKQKKPFLTYRDKPIESEVRYLPLMVGKTYTIVVGKNRTCIGHSEPASNKKIPCSSTTSNSFTDKHLESAQCTFCRAKESTYFMHLNGLSYEQLTILKKRPSTNYLNIFGNKVIKTGVTATTRKYTRVLEQGAFATLFFTDTDGYTSRIIESTVSKTYNIKQSITWSAKITTIKATVTLEDAQKALTKLYDQVSTLLKDTHPNTLLAKPEYHYNLDYYALDIPEQINQISLYEHVAANDSISGKIIGIYGEIILLKQNNGSIIGINTKSLLGFFLVITTDESLSSIATPPKPIEFYIKSYENLTLF